MAHMFTTFTITDRRSGTAGRAVIIVVVTMKKRRRNTIVRMLMVMIRRIDWQLLKDPGHGAAATAAAIFAEAIHVVAVEASNFRPTAAKTSAAAAAAIIIATMCTGRDAEQHGRRAAAAATVITPSTAAGVVSRCFCAQCSRISGG
jgi:cobalamin synthase